MDNEKGITLIEILASIIILSIVSMFVFNIIVSSQNQQKVQQKEQNNLYDLTYTLKLITKDVRMSTSYDDTSKTFLKDDKDKKIKIATYTFEPATRELKRNGYNESTGAPLSSTIIAKNISTFDIEYFASTKSIIIDITNNTNQQIKNTLFFREWNFGWKMKKAMHF